MGVSITLFRCHTSKYALKQAINTANVFHASLNNNKNGSDTNFDLILILI